MFLFHLTKEDQQKIHQILKQYQEDSRVQSMHGFVQHGRTSTYEHCMNVVKLSFWINKHLHLSANERALLAGALLHDFICMTGMRRVPGTDGMVQSPFPCMGKMQDGFFYGSQRRKYYQEPYVAADSLADS